MLRNTLNTFITATLIMLLGVSSSASAQTIVPMGNLMGTTSVTFGEGDEAVTYSSALKIDFAPKAPVLSSIAPETLEEGAESAIATFSITSRANGNANYTLEYDAALDNLEGNPAVTFDPATIENLGATAVLEVKGGLLVVPSDGGAADAEVNGIEATDKVMIDGVEYTVGTVADNGAIATITLVAPGLDGATPSMGTPIWEKQEVTVTLANIGDVEKEGLPSNVTVTVTASYDDLSNDTTFIASRTVEVLPWARTYVRNTTDEEKNPTPEEAATLPEENALLRGEKWYFSSLAGADPEEGLAEADYNKAAQVKAAAGDTLEYVIVVSAGNTQPEQEFTIVETYPPFTVEGSVVLEDEWTLSEKAQNWFIDESFSNDELAWEGGLVRNQVAHALYSLQLGEAEDLGGGDGGDIDLKTAEEIKLACNGSNPESFDKDLCHLQPWVADNGVDVATNPVCWDTNKFGDVMLQVGGNNPWVVGTAEQYNNEAYDCRTKCAGKSGESFFHCAAVAWSDNDAANSTVCEVANQNKSLVGADGWRVAGEWSMYSFAYVSKCKHNKSNKNF